MPIQSLPNFAEPLFNWITIGLCPLIRRQGKFRKCCPNILLMCLHKKRMIRHATGRPKRSQWIEKARKLGNSLCRELQLICGDLHARFLSHKIHEYPNTLLRINCVDCCNKISKRSGEHFHTVSLVQTFGGRNVPDASHLSIRPEINWSGRDFGLHSKLTSSDTPIVLLIERQGANSEFSLTNIYPGKRV